MPAQALDRVIAALTVTMHPFELLTRLKIIMYSTEDTIRASLLRGEVHSLNNQGSNLSRGVLRGSQYRRRDRDVRTPNLPLIVVLGDLTAAKHSLTTDLSSRNTSLRRGALQQPVMGLGAYTSTQNQHSNRPHLCNNSSSHKSMEMMLLLLLTVQ